MAHKKAHKVVKDLLYYDRVELITLNLFWIGFIVYTVSWTLSKSTQVNFIVCQLFQIAGMLTFIPAGLRLIQFRFSNEYQKILFILLIFWASLTVIRGLELNKDALKNIVFDPWFGAFLYFAPLIMLFPLRLIYIKKIFDVIVILGVFYVIYDIMFLSDLMEPDGENVLSREIVEYFSKTLSVTVAFILLTYTYHSRPKLFYALCILLLTIFFALVRARRGLLFMTVGPFFFLYLLYLYNVKKKTIVIVASAIVGVVSAGIVAYLANQDAFSYFELIEERGTEDTRSNVEENFFYDMEGLDYVIGRGMNGMYYSPTVSVGSYRGTLETDYLNMILKGGAISLILLLLIIVRSEEHT